MEDGRECVDLGAFIDGDGLVIWGGEDVRGGFGSGEVHHSSPVGDIWVKLVGASGEGEVDEIDGGGSEEDVGGLQVRVQPSQGVERSQPVSDVDGGMQDAAASDG